MPDIVFVDDARLQNKMGAAHWLEYFDDNNDGVADAAPLAAVLEDANADVVACLMGKGYTATRLEEMADAGDKVLSRIAANIAMGYAGERRPEWLNDEGKGPFDKLRADAMARLKLIGTAQQRVPSEAEVGRNTQVGGRVSKNQNRDGHFVIANTAEGRARGSRGPGGF